MANVSQKTTVRSLMIEARMHGVSIVKGVKLTLYEREHLGVQYGLLKVVKIVGIKKKAGTKHSGHMIFVICQCSCGSYTLRQIGLLNSARAQLHIGTCQKCQNQAANRVIAVAHGKKKKVNITQHTVDDALARFRAKGGIIKQLPTMDSPVITRVGQHHGAYENPS